MILDPDEGRKAELAWGVGEQWKKHNERLHISAYEIFTLTKERMARYMCNDHTIVANWLAGC